MMLPLFAGLAISSQTDSSRRNTFATRSPCGNPLQLWEFRLPQAARPHHRVDLAPRNGREVALVFTLRTRGLAETDQTVGITQGH